MDRRTRLTVLLALMVLSLAYVIHPSGPSGGRQGLAAALYYRGKALEAQKQYRLSWLAFKAAEKLDRRIANVPLMLGVIYTRWKDYERAEYEYRRALTMPLREDNRAITYSNLGTIYLENMGRFKDAIAAFIASISVDPKMVDPAFNPYMGLMRAYAAVGEYEKAVEQGLLSIRKHPQKAAGFYNLAVVYLMQGNNAAALEITKKLAVISPANAASVQRLIDGSRSRSAKNDAFMQRFSSELSQVMPQTNAALVYQGAAYQILGLPVDDFLRFFNQQAADVLAHGWQEDNRLLRAMVENNQQAIGGFKQAARLPLCDFSVLAGIPAHKDVYLSPSPALLPLARLIALSARKSLFENDLDHSLDCYLALLRFIGHLDRQAKGGATDINMENLLLDYSLPGFSDLLRSRRCTVLQCRLALNELGVLEKNLSDFTRVFREERELTELPDAAEIQGARQYMDQLAEKMHAKAVEAFRKNQPHIYLDERRRLQQRQTLMVGSRIAKGLLGVGGELTSQEQALLFGLALFPAYERITERYYLVRARLNLLCAMAAVRLYELERGQPPARLKDLVPQYLADVPKDPFNAFRPLKFARRHGTWAVYSIGPDRRDDGARFDYQTDSPKNTGDIIINNY